MKVWVVMANDYPDSVHDTLEAADKYVAAQKAKDQRPGTYRRIYWRHYGFEVQQ